MADMFGWVDENGVFHLEPMGFDLAKGPDWTSIGFYRSFPEPQLGTEPFFKGRAFRADEPLLKPVQFDSFWAELESAMASAAKQLGIPCPPPIGDSEMQPKIKFGYETIKTAVLAVDQSIKFNEARARESKQLHSLRDTMESWMRSGGGAITPVEWAMIAEAAKTAKYLATYFNSVHGATFGAKISIQNFGELMQIAREMQKRAAVFHFREWKEWTPPEPAKPVVPNLGDFIEIRANQPITAGPNKTQGTKVLLHGCEIKGVTQIDIECRTNDIWRAKIECIVAPPEVIPAKVVGVTQKTVGSCPDAIEITSLDSSAREYVLPSTNTAERFYASCDRGPVTYRGKIHGGATPLEKYRNTAAFGARNAVAAALKSLSAGGWNVPSVNGDELFKFIRDVTLNAR